MIDAINPLPMDPVVATADVVSGMTYVAEETSLASMTEIFRTSLTAPAYGRRPIDRIFLSFPDHRPEG